MDENEVMAAFLWSKQSQEMYSNQGLKDLHHLHQDFIINDYTDKIATNIDLLDTELKFAWAALNLLNEEYTKMSEKVFKLQSLNISQQRIVQNLQFMEENRKAYLDMIPDYAKHHEFSLQEQSRLRKDLEYRDRINEALINSGMIPLQEEQEEFLHQQHQQHQLHLQHHQQQQLYQQQMYHARHGPYEGMHLFDPHLIQQQQQQQLQQQQQVQQQFDNDFLLLQRNLANVPELQEAVALPTASRSAGHQQPPELPRLSTNPFLTAGEADRGLLRNIEPADSAAIIEEQLRTSFLNHAKQIELEFGTPKSKQYTADRLEKLQSEEVRELINKIMSEEDVASLSSEEMDRVRCFMAKNCSELMEVFDDDLQALYRKSVVPSPSPRSATGKYLPDGLATLTKDDLLTVENGTITIQDSTSEADFRLNLGTVVTTSTAGSEQECESGGHGSPKKLSEFSPFGLQATLLTNGAVQKPVEELEPLEPLAEPAADVVEVPKTTIPSTFGCTNLVGLTNGKQVFTGLRPNITEALEMTSCVTSQSLLAHQLSNGVETVDTRTASAAGGICAEGIAPPSRKASIVDIPVVKPLPDTADTAAILQAIISRRSSAAEPSTSPPTFQPLPGQTSITDSPEMQAIYDSLSRKSSLPTLSDTTFFPSLDITDSGFAGDTGDSLAMFAQLPVTLGGTGVDGAPISLPDFSTMSAISNGPDNSDCSSFLHMSMNSSGISEASDSVAFAQPETVLVTTTTTTALSVATCTTTTTTKLPALPAFGPTTTTMAALAEGKPIVEATATSVTVTSIVTANGTTSTLTTTAVTKSTPVMKSPPQQQPPPPPSKPAPTVLPVKQQSLPAPVVQPQPAPPQAPQAAEQKQAGGFFQSTTVNIGSFFNKVNKNLVHQESTDSTTIGAKSKSFFASMKSSFSLDSSKASVDEADVQPAVPAPVPVQPHATAAHLDVTQPAQAHQDLSPVSTISKGAITPEGSYHETTPNASSIEQQPSPPRDTTSFDGQLDPSPVGTQPSPLGEYPGGGPDESYQCGYEQEVDPQADTQSVLEKELEASGAGTPGAVSGTQRRQSLFRAQGSEGTSGRSSGQVPGP